MVREALAQERARCPSHVIRKDCAAPFSDGEYIASFSIRKFCFSKVFLDAIGNTLSSIFVLHNGQGEETRDYVVCWHSESLDAVAVMLHRPRIQSLMIWYGKTPHKRCAPRRPRVLHITPAPSLAIGSRTGSGSKTCPGSHGRYQLPQEAVREVVLVAALFTAADAGRESIADVAHSDYAAHDGRK